MGGGRGDVPSRVSRAEPLTEPDLLDSTSNVGKPRTELDTSMRICIVMTPILTYMLSETASIAQISIGILSRLYLNLRIGTSRS